MDLSYKIIKPSQILHYTSAILLILYFWQMHLPPVHMFIIAIFLAFFIEGCKNNDLDQVKLVTSRTNVNIEKGKDVTIQYSDHGNTKIKALAKTLTRFNVEKPYLEFPDGIKLTFYSNDKQVGTTMTADYASAVESSNIMTAQKNVEVINAKGEKLNTEEIIWDEQKKIIYSNAFVKITTKDEIIMGNGMEANEDFSDYVIKKVIGRVKVKTEKD
jgi:LPS export ABC transporter protein LptC